MYDIYIKIGPEWLRQYRLPMEDVKPKLAKLKEQGKTAKAKLAHRTH